MKSKARKRKPGGGRKPEGRVKVTWYVLPLTKTRVEYLVGPKANTPGKVVDSQFGVRATKKVAGARGGSAGERTGGPRGVKPRQAQNMTGLWRSLC